MFTPGWYKENKLSGPISTAQPNPSRNHVHSLDSATFKPFVESNNKIFLAIVVLPLSKLCQRFLPEFQLAAQGRCYDAGSDFVFAQIDFLESNDVAHELVLPFPKFPHIVLLENGQIVARYHGVLKAGCMDMWLTLFRANTRLKEITSLDSFSEFQRWTLYAGVVAFIALDDDESRAKITKLANELHPEFVFGICTDSSVAKRHQGPNGPEITMPSMIFNERGSIGHAVIPTDATPADLTVLLRQADMFPVENFFLELHDDYLKDVPIGYIFIDNEAERDQVRSSIEPIAEEFAGQIQLGIANAEHFEGIINDLRLQIKEFPAFAIRDPTTMHRYPMPSSDAPFPTAIKAFIRAYLSGDPPKPTIKSEPIPPPSDNAVVKVVGLNYNDIVLDTNKDVLLVYSITPCAPCDALLQTLEKLAEMYRSHSVFREQVTIAKIAYDKNDIPERELMAFPTLKLFPAARRGHPQFVEGVRALEDLAWWVGRFGTHKAMLDGAGESVLARPYPGF